VKCPGNITSKKEKDAVAFLVLASCRTSLTGGGINPRIGFEETFEETFELSTMV
jgi:hypothetical protein